MKKLSKIDVVVSAIVIILIIALATVFGALQVTGTVNFNVHPFMLMLTVLTLGIGLYVIGFAFVKKGGYEYAVGASLTLIGIILLMVCFKLLVWLIVIIGLGALLILAVIPFILKADSLVPTRTNESPDYIPYTEKLKAQKQEEKEREEELPKIKSFKD